MDGAGYAPSSGYQDLTLDTSGYMDTSDQLGSVSRSGLPPGHSHKKERDGTEIQMPASIVGSASNRPLTLSSNMSASGSNLTDFTKRKNWSQRIIEELKDFLHVLTPSGKVMYCSPSSLELVGYAPEELVGRQITEFIHVDDIDMFIREFNMSIHMRKEFKLYYRFRKKDDKFIIFEVTGHPYFDDSSSGNSGLPKCFFGMAQPYPTKATSMLDSFLELKMENELLRRKLRAMRTQHQEERAEKASAHAAQLASAAGLPVGQGIQGASVPSGIGMSAEDGMDADEDEEGPGGAGTALDDMDNEGEMMGPEQEAEVMQSLAVYAAGAQAGANLTETVQMFTGLRYMEGERAQGVSRGLPGAALMNEGMMEVGEQAGMIMGDLGLGLPSVGDISISKPMLNRGSGQDGITVIGPANILGGSLGSAQVAVEEKTKPRKKKKPKMEDDEYVCTDCGTTESPEWRKGPMGPKTLCNACGLRWAKKNKKGGPGGNGNGEGMED